MDPTLACVRSIQLIGMHPFFRIMDIQMFEQIVAKNGLEWPKFSSFIRCCSTMLKVIVIGM